MRDEKRVDGLSPSGLEYAIFQMNTQTEKKKNANDLPLPESTILMAVYSLLCNGPETVAVSST